MTFSIVPDPPSTPVEEVIDFFLPREAWLTVRKPGTSILMSLYLSVSEAGVSIQSFPYLGESRHRLLQMTIPFYGVEEIEGPIPEPLRTSLELTEDQEAVRHMESVVKEAGLDLRATKKNWTYPSTPHSSPSPFSEYLYGANYFRGAVFCLDSSMGEEVRLESAAGKPYVVYVGVPKQISAMTALYSNLIKKIRSGVDADEWFRKYHADLRDLLLVAAFVCGDAPEKALNLLNEVRSRLMPAAPSEEKTALAREAISEISNTASTDPKVTAYEESVAAFSKAFRVRQQYWEEMHRAWENLPEELREGKDSPSTTHLQLHFPQMRGGS